MLLGRRDLLVRTGVLLGAGALAAAGCRSDEEAREAGATAGLDTWEGVRAGFDLAGDRVQLASFLLAPHPRPVRDAIAEHRRALDADPSYLQENEERLEAEVLQEAAGYLGVAPDEIALTVSTTMGLGLLYASLDLREGEEVVTTEHDFYSTHEALRLRAKATGAAVRRVALYGDPATASPDEIAAAIDGAVTARTRVVALTWVHSSTGVKLPVRAIADTLARADERLGKERRTLLCVDAVHAFGVEPDALPELGCDFLVSGCHKWLFGPRGTGLVWGLTRPGRIRPRRFRPSPTAKASWPGSGLVTRPGPRRPRPSRPAATRRSSIGGPSLRRSRFAGRSGRERAAERTRALATRLKEGLLETPGVILRTPLDEGLSAGLVCCDVDLPTTTLDDLVFRLRRDHGVVATLTPYAASYLRFGPSIVNSEEDVDTALAALRELVS